MDTNSKQKPELTKYARELIRHMALELVGTVGFTEGIGKSTTAAQALKPIFIPTEDGLDQIDCASFPLATSLADVESALQSLIHEPHDFEAVIIDSLDWLERLVWDALCQQSPLCRM